MRKPTAVYALLALAGLVGPWYFNIRYALGGGSPTDIPAALELAFANSVSSSLSTDLFIAYLAFALWAVLEARRIGIPRGWVYPLLGLCVSFAFAFPLFLYQRERHSAREESS